MRDPGTQFGLFPVTFFDVASALLNRRLSEPLQTTVPANEEASMYNDDLGSLAKLRRLPARKVEKPINFTLIAPEAQRVTLVGDFNEWNPELTPLRRQPDGGWATQVVLSHGHHRYLFIVDGEPILDPRASGTSREEVEDCEYLYSLLAVS